MDHEFPVRVAGLGRHCECIHHQLKKSVGVSIDQPTTRPPEGIEDCAAVNLALSGVGCSVMSVNQSWFGAALRKFRLTRSSAVTW